MATSLTILQLYPQLSSINFVASRSGRKVKAQRTSTGAGIQFPAAERCHDLELLPYKSIVAGLGTASAGSITADNIVFMGESRSVRRFCSLSPAKTSSSDCPVLSLCQLGLYCRMTSRERICSSSWPQASI